MNIITAESISKSYSKTKALDNVSIEIPEGKIFGLLGPNGAGKTTFIRILNQIIYPDSGTVLFRNKSLKQIDSTRIGYLPEERGLYKKMKVGEQALYLAGLKGMNKLEAKKELEFWFEKLQISQWWNKSIDELSKGMQQKVQFIVTVLHKPELLILDEPFSGFDPINAELIKNEILELQKQGTTIILSTHNMNSVEELCNSIALFNKSKKILDGGVKEIKQYNKTGMYKIVFTGYFNKISAALSSSYTIIDQVQNDSDTILTIKLTEDVPSNNLIQHFLGVGSISSFQEVLPSMNDVFLQAVQSNKIGGENE